ncbi:MAG: hypothetical protein WCT08_01175 [Patescibacteria group bacterium]|jgi:hypothetical protein
MSLSTLKPIPVRLAEAKKLNIIGTLAFLATIAVLTLSLLLDGKLPEFILVIFRHAVVMVGVIALILAGAGYVLQILAEADKASLQQA